MVTLLAYGEYCLCYFSVFVSSECCLQLLFVVFVVSILFLFVDMISCASGSDWKKPKAGHGRQGTNQKGSYLQYFGSVMLMYTILMYVKITLNYCYISLVLRFSIVD